MATIGHYDSWENSFQSAMREIQDGLHPDELTARQRYAVRVCDFLIEYDPNNKLPPSRSSDIAARFWEFGMTEGFTAESIQRMSEATKTGKGMGAVLIVCALVAVGVFIGAVM